MQPEARVTSRRVFRSLVLARIIEPTSNPAEGVRLVIPHHRRLQLNRSGL
jgi:hypothetical protein